jgi:hypothetical protein
LETKHILFALWIIVVLIWLINHFYYKNQQRELVYRKARAAAKAAEGS